MISHIDGVLRKKNEDEMSVEVDVGGIWYEVTLPAFVWRAFEATELGTEISLETFYYVAERQPTPRLIGFSREIERDFFKKFIAVPKVGAMTATKALIFSVSTIAAWIEQGDTAAIKRLPGIGTRSAETIIAQLKGKVYEEAMLRDEGFAAQPPAGEPATLSESQQFAVDGLVRLGYKASEAKSWVEQVAGEDGPDGPIEAEEIIRAVFSLRSQEIG